MYHKDSGSILTAYGTHYRAVQEGWEPFYGPRDTGLVKWDLNPYEKPKERAYK